MNEIQKTNVPVFSSDIIYTIIESYERWVEDQKNKMEQERLEAVIRRGQCAYFQIVSSGNLSPLWWEFR